MGPAPRNQDAARRRVLVVDDDQVALRALRILLSDQFDLILTADPREAVRVLREQPVDAVVTDLRMPHLDGIELLRVLRESASRDTIPCIFMSAGADARERIRLAAEGPLVDFLAKPLDPDELAARIDAALMEAEARRTPHLEIVQP